MFSLEKDEKEILYQRKIEIATERINEAYSETDFIRHLPFKVSMLGLGKYYEVEIHQDYKENLVVVIGDNVSDFCLYYCLSRIHEGIHWLPDHFLKEANDKVSTNEGRSTEEREKFMEAEEFAASMTVAYFRKIGYGHEQKHINIISASLNDEQIQERKLWMGNISWLRGVELSGERSFLDNVIVTPLLKLPIHCVCRVLEANNYANQQDMIFQDNKSVGRLNTPKPKNFKYVDPAKHRWITSVAIEGYHPPVLPLLSQEIFASLPASYDTRVSIDGLAYMCPHIAYFGGDVDVNTVRPSLHLMNPNEIFEKYFQYSGYDIELSDKGNYLKDTIERFGSLQATAAFFRNKCNRDIFDQYLYKKAQADSEVIYLHTEKRTYLSFNAFSRKLDDSRKARDLIDDLITKDILRRGLIFQCSRCRQAAWYDIGGYITEISM